MSTKSIWSKFGQGLVVGLIVIAAIGGPVWSVRAQSPQPPTETTITAQANSSWPQVQGDAGHSGYVPQTVSPPYSVLWRVNTSPVSGRVQPIIADGLVFIPSNNGCLYAYRATNGTSAWNYCTNGALVNSVAYDSGRVFIGSTDHYLYALNASLTAATLAWRYETDSAIKGAPIVAEGKVFVGSADGYFYAVNTTNGTLAWRQSIGAPIYDTAAYSNGRVFFGGMDSVGYALNAANGNLVWKQTIPGQGFRDRWTVAGNGRVFFTPILYSSHHEALRGGTDLFHADASPVIYNQSWATQRQTILNYLNAHPYLRPLYVFNETNGSTPFTPPVLYASGGSQSPHSQVVLLPNGNANVIYRRSFGEPSQYGATTNSALFTGELNLSTGDITPVDTCVRGSGGWADCGLYKSAFTSDESATLMRSGNVIYLDVARGTYGLDTVNKKRLSTIATYNPGSGSPYDLKATVTYSDYVDPPDYKLGWRVDYENIRSEISSDGNDLKRPTPIVGDTFYVFHYNTLVAVKGTITAGSSAAPSNDTASPEATTAAPAEHAIAPAAVSDPRVWGQDELERRVEEMMNLGHLAPTLYFNGLSGGDGIAFYVTPNETLYTLSAAYPYLPANLQTRVKTFLAGELSKYPPHTTGYYSPNCCTVADQEGARREYFAPRQDQNFNYWPGVSPHVSTLYSLWLYAYNTGDWSYVTNNYDGLKSLYSSFRSQSGGVINNYPALAGVLGFARIAQHTGHTADYNSAWTLAQQGMTSGANFNQFLATAQNTYDVKEESDFTSPVFMFNNRPIALHFDPDLGELLRTRAQTAVSNYASQLEHDLPLWWLTAPAMSHYENAYAPPEVGWTNFMLHAYVLGDTPEKLQSYLVDAPDRKGDLLYIQKLVALLDAAGGPIPDLRSSTKSTSAWAPKTGQVFTYTITLRNTGIPLTSTVYLTDSVPAGLTYVPGTLAATSGSINAAGTPTLRWSGFLSPTRVVTVTFAVTVTTNEARLIKNTATIVATGFPVITRTTTIAANGSVGFLPIVRRQ